MLITNQQKRVKMNNQLIENLAKQMGVSVEDVK